MRQALLVLSLLGLSACGRETPVVSEGYPPGEGPSAPATPTREDPLYDAEGRLRESDRVIAGLPMPVGLELRYEGDRRHVFHSKLPIQDLLRYFGPRLITGEVTPLGEGAVYRNGVPRGVKGGVVRLDVAIRPTPKGAQIEILELPPPPADPPSPAELSRQLEQQMLQ
ncbi:MAG: hypothetical protein GXY23_05405 [Myxococcales bacterium]|nr:hypothetical protein [Myxococcales bacterium]